MQSGGRYVSAGTMQAHRPTNPDAAGHAVFHGRTLDGNVIKASYVPEEEYSRAAAGEWVSKAR